MHLKLQVADRLCLIMKLSCHSWKQQIEFTKPSARPRGSDKKHPVHVFGLLVPVTEGSGFGFFTYIIYPQAIIAG